MHKDGELRPDPYKESGVTTGKPTNSVLGRGDRDRKISGLAGQASLAKNGKFQAR